jgi:hypothetical protein
MLDAWFKDLSATVEMTGSKKHSRHFERSATKPRNLIIGFLIILKSNSSAVL